MIQNNSLFKPAKIFIGGLGTETQIDTLKKYYEKYGEIIDSVIMIDKITNRSRGFGFITFKDSTNIENLLKDQPHFIDGKQVECKIAIPKEQINTISEANLDESTMSYKAHKIFVGGLPPNLKESEMHNYFAKFGEIEQCVIMHDKPSGKSRGFGFVIFKDEKSIDTVMDMKNNHNIMGKWVDCKRAMPKEVIKEASYKNLKQLEQKSQRELSSKFNITNNYQETMDKSAFLTNQVLSIPKKENQEDAVNKKKKINSLISDEFLQTNSNSKISNYLITTTTINSGIPNDMQNTSNDVYSNSKESKKNTSGSLGAINNINSMNKGSGAVEANNYSNCNVNNFTGNNQNQNNNFYGVNYNNFYSNSNIININNFNYPQNFMYQQNIPNTMYAPGYPFNTNPNNSSGNQASFTGFPKNPNGTPTANLNNNNNININIKKKNLEELGVLEAEEKKNLSILNTKKPKNIKVFEDNEETLRQDLTDYSEENAVLCEKEPLEDSESEGDLKEDTEYEQELLIRNSNLNEASAQQKDANKFNFNFSYNFNSINNPFRPGMPGFAEASAKFHEKTNANPYSNSNNNSSTAKFPFANNNNINSNSTNNFFGYSNPNEAPFFNFNNNLHNSFNTNNNNNNGFPFNEFTAIGNNNSNYGFTGFDDGFNFSLFSGDNQNKNNFMNNNSNITNNSNNNNFNNINPNIFPNGSANRNVYNFFNNNYNNDNNSLMNYNIFDMINADSALIFSYFNKLNLNEDSASNYGSKSGNKLSSYYQYKLFDFNGENINFECLNYDQNKEKVQLFKEDELEKEKYNIAKTIDEESIEEKLENENFFGPHKENTKKDRVFKPY